MTIMMQITMMIMIPMMKMMIMKTVNGDHLRVVAAKSLADPLYSSTAVTAWVALAT